MKEQGKIRYIGLSSHRVPAALAYLQAEDSEKDYSILTASVLKPAKGTCMYCKHCLPCPQSIDVGLVTRMTDTTRYGLTEKLAAEYAKLTVKAAACTRCGACMKRCPFDVDVTGNMKEALELSGC